MQDFRTKNDAYCFYKYLRTRSNSFKYVYAKIQPSPMGYNLPSFFGHQLKIKQFTKIQQN